MDEVFGPEKFRNEIAWRRSNGASDSSNTQFVRNHDTIVFYSKSADNMFKKSYRPYSETTLKMYKNDDNDGRGCYRLQELRNYTEESIAKMREQGRIADVKGKRYLKQFLTDKPGVVMDCIWEDIPSIQGSGAERLNYPTQKPEKLLWRIIEASSSPGDLVFDCFMGSGTTQAVAMKLGRRFIGADINLGAIQTTTKRLINVAAELNQELPDREHPKYTGFSVYNVNNYDVFRNPVEAKDLLVQALELDPLPGNTVYDGLDEDWYVKIMPVNRIATRQDLNEIEANFPIKEAEKFKLEHPNKVFQKIRLVCMGHEPALDAELKKMIPYNIEVEILDILRDKSDLRFKRDAEAKIRRTKKKLIIEKFYPMNLMEKLSMQKEKVKDWREMVESVMIDFNYDGSVFTPTVTDIPEKDEFVKGEYDIPEDAGTIRVKITDLLSESLEQEVS